MLYILISPFYFTLIGWIVRIYHNSTIHPDELIKILRVNDNLVDLCNATEMIEDLQMDQNIFAKVWRWV